MSTKTKISPVPFTALLFVLLSYVHHGQIKSPGTEKVKTITHAIEKKIYIQKNDTLPYRLIYPGEENSAKKLPLLIYLHGMGSRGNDNEKPSQKFSSFFTDSLQRTSYPCYVLVPQCPLTDVWVSFPQFPNSLTATQNPTPSTKLVLELIRYLIESKNIDKDRIYLTGYSMGGEGTFDLLSREPSLFACGVPLASVADTANADRIKNIPIWAFHGSSDKVNDVKYPRLMVEAIRKKGGRPKFTELQGVQHDCMKEAYGNPELWKWVFEQRRN